MIEANETEITGPVARNFSTLDLTRCQTCSSLGHLFPPGRGKRPRSAPHNEQVPLHAGVGVEGCHIFGLHPDSRDREGVVHGIGGRTLYTVGSWSKCNFSLSQLGRAVPFGRQVQFRLAACRRPFDGNSGSLLPASYLNKLANLQVYHIKDPAVSGLEEPEEARLGRLAEDFISQSLRRPPFGKYNGKTTFGGKAPNEKCRDGTGLR